jgi:tetratricopeptide (TPR) repeat protein
MLQYLAKKKETKKINAIIKCKKSVCHPLTTLLTYAESLSETGEYAQARKIMCMVEMRVQRMQRICRQPLPTWVYRIASVYKRNRCYEKSFALFQAVLTQTNEKNIISGSFFHRGEMSYFVGNKRDAKKYFQKCLKINKNYRKAYRYYKLLQSTK